MKDLVLTIPMSTVLSNGAAVLICILTALRLMCFLAPFAFIGVNAVTRRSKAIHAIVEEHHRRLSDWEQRMHADIRERSEQNRSCLLCFIIFIFSARTNVTRSVRMERSG